MKKRSIKKPFFVVNPKSYLFGKDLLDLALEADKLAEDSRITIFFTAPYADIFNISKNTKNIIVTAQHVDGIMPGRGMGHVLADSIYEAGARATFLNHAENPMLYGDLVKSMDRCNELGISTIVCANTIIESKAVALLNPDIILCEPTELIGTGVTSDEDYILGTQEEIKNVNSDVLIMQAAGISNEKDVERVMKLGADGTGCTSGIVKADDPKEMLKKMIVAIKVNLGE